MRFKVGDEVIAVKPCDFVDSFVGRKGKITYIYDKKMRLPVSVHFEKTAVYSECTWSCEETSLDFADKKEGNQYLFDFDK